MSDSPEASSKPGKDDNATATTTTRGRSKNPSRRSKTQGMALAAAPSSKNDDMDKDVDMDEDDGDENDEAADGDEQDDEDDDKDNDPDVIESSVEEENEDENEQGSDDEGDDDDDDDDDNGDYFQSKASTRRSSRVAKNSKAATAAARGKRGRGGGGAATTNAAAAAAATAAVGRRTSSRSTKFTSSMAEPTGVRDLLVATATLPEAKKKRATAAVTRRGGGGGAKGGRKTKSNNGSTTSESSSDDEDSNDDGDDSAGKKGHSKKRTNAAAASATGYTRAALRRATTRRQPDPTVRDSLASVSTTDGGGGGGDKDSSPKKSPARRHGKARRRSLRPNDKANNSAGKSDDDDYDDDSDDDDDAQASVAGHDDDEDDEDEWSDIKIQRIIACRTETLATWRKICSTMNTSEIDNGSRWFQSSRCDANGDAGSSRKSTKETGTDGMIGKVDNDSNDNDANKHNAIMVNENEVFEERFLVKWADLSYMHCSWETLSDLCDQVENAKSYHSTFLKKSVNGLLFTADERADGQYFDPRYIQVERTLDVSVDDEYIRLPQTAEYEDTVGATDFGIVVDKNDPGYEDGVGRQVLVKWGGNTPYSDCTYEYERDFVLQSIEYKEQIKSFWNRRSKPSKSVMTVLLKKGDEERRRLYKSLGDNSNITDEDREKFAAAYQKNLEEHVFKNGGTLRDYQAAGVSWMIANYINDRNFILADEMGLGKTLQTATTLNIIATQLDRAGIFLVVVPLSTLSHWLREFNSWTDLNAIVYHGTADDRQTIREFEMAYEQDRPQGGVGINQYYLRKCGPKKFTKKESPWMAQVVITTPEMLVSDAELFAIHWTVVVVDEAQKCKNINSKMSVQLRQHADSIDHMILLSGTPIQNNMEELFALLTLIDPEAYPDADAFMEKYGDLKNKTKDVVDSLHAEVRPYILRRMKEDVETSVPPKEETIIEVELTMSQKTYYKALLEKNIRFLHKNKSKALDGPSLSNLAMQLRKCCNSVLLLNGIEEELAKDHDMVDGDFLVQSSGKLVLLDKLLPRLREQGHRVLIFSQFKIMLDILEDYLDARHMKFERIDGSITGHSRQMAIDRYQNSDSKDPPFVMLLSTRAGGVGINLTAADTCIIFDSDFNPQNDLQAQARCHRIGQENKVQVYRLLSSRTYEMQMFHMSSLKMGLDQVVLKGFENGASGDGGLSKEEVEKLLRHGAYDILNEEKDGKSEETTNDFIQADIDAILERRSRTVVRDGPGASAAGGTFSKASFKVAKSPDGSQGPSSRDDVDIDDPDFWKKMLGEKHFQEDLHGTVKGTRKRTKANYREPKYAELDVTEDMSGGSDNDSESSFDSDGDDNNGERSRWGGSLPQHWKKDQVESLVQVLLAFGYGNLPWNDFQQRVDGIAGKSELEIRRMCFSIVLRVISEATAADASASKKREERAAEKRAAEAEADKAEEGGQLAVDRSMDSSMDLSNIDDLKNNVFSKLWKTHSSWIGGALLDALAYVKESTAREPATLHNALHPSEPIATKISSEMSTVVSAFEQNVWPSLASRGWQSEDGDYVGRMRYIFKGEEFSSLEKLLIAAKSRHPEIEHVIDRALSEVQAIKRKELDEKEKEKEKYLDITAANVNLSHLQSLLDSYAPLQLLVDRPRQQGLGLPRKLLSACLSMQTATDVVKRAKAAFGDDFSLDQLSSLIAVDQRPFVPHPLWTTQHDAALLNAIAKHGWIECDSSCREITADSSIQWGPPFDLKAKVGAAAPLKVTPDLLEVAGRAASLLGKHGAILESVKSFDRDAIVRAYCLRRHVPESAATGGHVSADSPPWHVNMEGLMEATGATAEPVDLPAKKDLARRVKAVLSRTSDPKDTTLAAASSTAKVGHNFTVLDQSDRANTLLAQLMRASMSKTGTTCTKMFDLALDEANKRIEDVVAKMKDSPESDKGVVANQEQELRRIANHIDLAKRTQSRSARLSKNVIRVILAQNPHPPKVPGEPYFPSEKIAPAALKMAGQVAATKSSAELAMEAAQQRMADQNTSRGSDTKPAAGATCLLNLTKVETQLVQAVCLFGLPVWTEQWKILLDPSSSFASGAAQPTRNRHTLTWGKIGRCLSQISNDDLNVATADLVTAKEHPENDSGLDAQSKSDEMLWLAERNYETAEHAYGLAVDYSSDNEGLAKKAIILCAKIVKMVGSITPSMNSDNGLGTKVLRYLADQVLAWAKSLDMLDDAGQPYAVSAEDFLSELSESERSGFVLSSSFDKKDCRGLLSQIAMISRARAIFSDLPGDAVDGRLEVAVASIPEKWPNQPSWWGTSRDSAAARSILHDRLLLKRLLYSGFLGVLECKVTFGIDALHSGKSFQHFQLTKGDIQFRCNQLTRELHATEGSSDSVHILEESQNKKNGGRVTQQATIESFFSRPSGKAKAKAPPPKNGIKPTRQAASPGASSKVSAPRREVPEQACCYSDVEVVEFCGTTQHEDGGASKKAKTKSSSKSTKRSEHVYYSDCEIIDSPPTPIKNGTKKNNVDDGGDDMVCYDVEESPARAKGKRKDPGSDDDSSSSADSSISEKKPRAS